MALEISPRSDGGLFFVELFVFIFSHYNTGRNGDLDLSGWSGMIDL